MRRRWIVALGLVLVLGVASVFAVTRLQKLSENRYLITLKKSSGYGGEGKVLRQLNVKAASLCAVVGFQWFEVQEQTSHGRGFFRTAAGTVEVKLFHEEEKEDLNDCELLATDDEKRKMASAYAKATKGGEEEDKKENEPEP